MFETVERLQTATDGQAWSWLNRELQKAHQVCKTRGRVSSILTLRTEAILDFPNVGLMSLSPIQEARTDILIVQIFKKTIPIEDLAPSSK